MVESRIDRRSYCKKGVKMNKEKAIEYIKYLIDKIKDYPDDKFIFLFIYANNEICKTDLNFSNMQIKNKDKLLAHLNEVIISIEESSKINVSIYTHIDVHTCATHICYYDDEDLSLELNDYNETEDIDIEHQTFGRFIHEEIID
jgi:hypothetical protein